MSDIARAEGTEVAGKINSLLKPTYPTGYKLDY
jgi:hypothetical protein